MLSAAKLQGPSYTQCSTVFLAGGLYQLHIDWCSWPSPGALRAHWARQRRDLPPGRFVQVPLGLVLSYYSANFITALKLSLLKTKLFSVKGIPACGPRAAFKGWTGSDVSWQQSAGGLMKCDRFVFSVDGKIPGPDPANSSSDTETAGSGLFPSSPKRRGGGVYRARDKDLLPCRIGDFCVILCMHLLYGKPAWRRWY